MLKTQVGDTGCDSHALTCMPSWPDYQKKKKKGDRRLDYNTQKVSVTSFSVQDAIDVYQKLLFGAMFNISYVLPRKIIIIIISNNRDYF